MLHTFKTSVLISANAVYCRAKIRVSSEWCIQCIITMLIAGRTVFAMCYLYRNFFYCLIIYLQSCRLPQLLVALINYILPKILF